MMMRQEESMVEVETVGAGNANIVVVSVSGDIDILNASRLQRLTLALADAGTTRMVLDLEGVSFMSSVGIGACVALLRAMKEYGGRLVLAGMKKRIEEVFALLGFTQFFEIAADREAALSAFSCDEGKPDLPRIDRCPICGRRIRLAKAGRFRCSRCSSVIRVTANGELLLG